MRRCLSVIVVLAFASAPGTAAAGDWGIVPDGPQYRREASGGGDGTGAAVSVYTGATTALTGDDIRYDGLRLRSAAGYGTYSYTSLRWNGVNQVPVTFHGTQSYTDLMVGQQKAIGPWIIKLFVGATIEQHALTPFDDENSVQGRRVGAKVALETWTRLGDQAFLQTDSSWSQAFQAYGARARAGYVVISGVSVGLEAAVNGNEVYGAARAGSFARYEWGRGEVSLSGGMAGDRAGATGPYGSLGLLFRF